MEITLYLLEKLAFFITQQFGDNYWINRAFRHITHKEGKFEKHILRNCILINPIKSSFNILISPDPLEGIQPLLSMSDVCTPVLVGAALLLTVLCSNFRKYNYVHKMILL